MENKREKVGFVVWAVIALLLSAGAGYLTNVGLTKVTWMPDWVNITLSVFVGIVILVVAVVGTLFYLIFNDPNFDNNGPDFGGV